MKLWYIYKSTHPEDWWLTVAENEKELLKKYNKEFGETFSKDEFYENFLWDSIDNVDEYHITVIKTQ